jgi:ADP-heptose:LPS heptosyltransferase
MNFERVTYIGDRHAVGKEFNRRRYIFNFGQSVMVPDDFGEILLGTAEFVLSDDFGKALVEVHEEGKTLLFRRWGALGDLIMFRAAVACFLRHYSYTLILRCQERFKSLFVNDPMWKDVHIIGGTHTTKFDGVVSFDQVAEADHRGDHTHRAQLFLNAMTTERITLTAEDWKLPIPDHVDTWVQRHLGARAILENQRDRPLIALNTRGSGPMKTLPKRVTLDLVERLSMDYYVILLEPLMNEARRFLVNDCVFEMTHRDALHAMRLLEHVDLAIVMDSGPLWMAHVANCPTLAVLGPTRPEQRIGLHPSYPEKVRAVCLNELIDCPACFEAADDCQQTFRCMQNQPDWRRVINLIATEVDSMMKGDVRLPIASNET